MSMWHPDIPKLQLYWDATSLKALMTCPRKYQYEIVEGYRGSKIDLEFGRIYASAVERYKKAILAGVDWAEAQRSAVRYALDETCIDGVWFGGEYAVHWRCTGAEPYRNLKGNRAKCPLSHKGKWIWGEPPVVCGTCGSPTERANRWMSEKPEKDRFALVRLVSWYCEENAGDGGVSPITLGEGIPAVELSFKVPLPIDAPGGYTYVACGHIDNLVTDGLSNYVADDKTTKMTLGKSYWKTFNPDVQVEWYDLCGTALYPALDLQGVMIEAAQTMVTGARFGKTIIRRTDETREAMLRDVEIYLRQAESYAREGYWPQNRAACWRCPFQSVCAELPAYRQAALDADFTVSRWDPTEER